MPKLRGTVREALNRANMIEEPQYSCMHVRPAGTMPFYLAINHMSKLHAIDALLVMTFNRFSEIDWQEERKIDSR